MQYEYKPTRKFLNNLLLKSYLRCKRKAWLDLWGEKSLKSWSAQQSIYLITEFSNFNQFTSGDLFKGRKACEKGVKGVIGIKIRDTLKNNLKGLLLFKGKFSR